MGMWRVADGCLELRLLGLAGSLVSWEASCLFWVPLAPFFLAAAPWIGGSDSVFSWALCEEIA